MQTCLHLRFTGDSLLGWQFLLVSDFIPQELKARGYDPNEVLTSSQMVSGTGVFLQRHHDRRNGFAGL
jgi:hypothetical protein